MCNYCYLTFELTLVPHEELIKLQIYKFNSKITNSANNINKYLCMACNVFFDVMYVLINTRSS
jgi:hypothetical protein